MVAEHTFGGQCSRCRAMITATVTFSSSGAHELAPPPVIGSYCGCGTAKQPGGLNGAQAVPLTLRGCPE